MFNFYFNSIKYFSRFRFRKKLFSFSLVSTILLLIASVGFEFTMDDTPTYRELAEHWSPFIYQSTEGSFDYITKLDYDESI